MTLICKRCGKETWTLYVGGIGPDCFFDNGPCHMALPPRTDKR